MRQKKSILQRIPHDPDIAERFARVRKAHGMSQEAFANELGISRSAYQSYERGERDVPLVVAKRCADVFGIDLLWISYSDGEKRVLERDLRILRHGQRLGEFVDLEVRKLGRIISNEKRYEAIEMLLAEFLLSGAKVAELSETDEFRAINLIRSMSEAA